MPKINKQSLVALVGLVAATASTVSMAAGDAVADAAQAGLTGAQATGLTILGSMVGVAAAVVIVKKMAGKFGLTL